VPFTNPGIAVCDRALPPIHGKTMLRRDTNTSRYAGQPVVRHSRALACGVGVYSMSESYRQGNLPA
jgi:hypothetical protein